MNLLIPELAVAFILTFARVGTLVMLMPGVGEQFLSARFRLSFALLFTLVLFPVTKPLFPIQEISAKTIGLLLGEIAIGLLIGASVRILLMALQTTGLIIAQQLGLAFSMSVDPTMGGQQPAIGNFLALLGLALIFANDLHHLLFSAMLDSYDFFPPGGFPATNDAATLILKAVAQSFSLSVQISAPFIVFGLLFNLGLGVLSRLMPQIQVFFLSLPASILGGMIILMAVVGVMMNIFLLSFSGFVQQFQVN